MSSYIMALVVTAEQENAIINLYRESRWVYLKIDLTQKPCDVTKWPGELIEKLQIISSGTHDSDQQSENTSQQHNTTPAIAAKTSVPSLNYGKETRDNSQLAIKHELPDDSKQGHENPYIETVVHKDSSSSAIDITPDVNIQPVKCETACLYSAEDNKQLYEEPYSETIIPKDISSSAIVTTLDTNIQPVKYSNTSPTKSLKISTVMASKQNLNRQKACEGNMNQMENSRSVETTMDGARNELIPNKQQQKDIYAESSLNNAHTPSTNLHTTSKGDNIVLKSGHTHEMQCNFQCQECKKMFATKRYLTKHLKRCRLHENPFKCDRCPFSCKEEYNLHIHKLKNHNVENGRYPCLKCPRVFGLLKTLFEHLICKHRLGNVPDVPCSICGKVIFSRYLKKHEETHTETKQHKCDECPAAFRTRGGLTKHRQIHSSVKSYYCESCGKGFFTREKLKLHRRIHTGEKPYACTLCDYRCALGPNLRKHMKVHEKIS